MISVMVDSVLRINYYSEHIRKQKQILIEEITNQNRN